MGQVYGRPTEGASPTKASPLIRYLLSILASLLHNIPTAFP